MKLCTIDVGVKEVIDEDKIKNTSENYGMTTGIW